MSKIRDFIQASWAYIIVILACVIYILRGLLVIGETEKTIGQIISDGALAFFFGLFVTMFLGIDGMKRGETDEILLSTKERHGKIVEEISPHIHLLDKWCEKENEKSLRLRRIRILSRDGLGYKDYFNEDGTAKDLHFARDEKFKKRTFRAAIKAKITYLTPNILTSDGGREDDVNYLGKDKHQYLVESETVGLLTKIGSTCLFGYYGIGLIQDFSWGALIWTTVQVMFFLIMGAIKFYQRYTFMIGDFRNRIIKKIDRLQKFKNYIEEGHNE